MISALLTLSQAGKAQPPGAAPVEGTTRIITLGNGNFGNSAANASDAPNSLEQILPELYWNEAERGPLLIIDPAKTTRVWEKPVIKDGVPQPVQPRKPPEKGRDGYRLTALREYFGRRIVPVNTITVFAPEMMVVLNEPRGKPNVYADMNPAQRAQLLFASLSKQQWQLLTTSNGLGAGDLNQKQRENFLAIFPKPLGLTKLVGRDGQPPSGERAIVTAEQVAGIRLRIQRNLDWYFRYGTNGTASIGVGMGKLPAGQVRYRLNSFRMPMFMSGQGNTSLFGVNLREEVPAKSKPSQLPYEWNALQVSVAMEGAKTVGDLIDRVRTATRVEVYADIRYRSLPVYIRGNLANAGDILKAIAYGVTGTYRRLENTFLLVDDVEGMGTRQAKIAAWIAAGAAELTQISMESEQALRNSPAKEMVQWDSNDPLTPSAEVQQKIAEFQAKRGQPLTAEEKKRGQRELSVPVNLLPTTAQELVRQQVESWEQGRRNNPENNQEPIRADEVLLQLQAKMVLIIPGIGVVEADGLGTNSFGQDLFFGQDDFAEINPNSQEVKELPLITDSLQRTLIFRPSTPEEAVQGVQLAKGKGFTRVWLATDGVTIPILTAGVKAGAEVGIPVGVLVQVLRNGTEKSPLADRTLVGETSTEYVIRRLREPLPPKVNAPYQMYEVQIQHRRHQEWTKSRKRGDWLRCDSPETLSTVLAKVREIAAIPGIAEIALTDLVPDGYSGSMELYGRGEMREFGDSGFLGYTEGMRVAFIRQNSIDPVDLSPFSNGRLNAFRFRGPFGSGVDLSLPLLPDYGTYGRFGGGTSSYNGVDAIELGAKDSYDKWVVFRTTTARRFAQELLKNIRVAHPDIPIYVKHNGESGGLLRVNQNYSRVGEIDKAVEAIVPMPQPRERTRPDTTGKIPPRGELAKQYTDQAYLLVECLPAIESKERLSEFKRQVYPWLNPAVQKWDGLVVDISLFPMKEIPMLMEAIKPQPPSEKAVKQ
jgi:hypothetical protein